MSLKLTSQLGARAVQVAPLVTRWPFVPYDVAGVSQARPIAVNAAGTAGASLMSPIFSLADTYLGAPLGDDTNTVHPCAGHILTGWAFSDNGPANVELIVYTSPVGALQPQAEYFWLVTPFVLAVIGPFTIPGSFFRLLVNNADPQSGQNITTDFTFRSA